MLECYIIINEEIDHISKKYYIILLYLLIIIIFLIILYIKM